jgi:hypothetical protein
MSIISNKPKVNIFTTCLQLISTVLAKKMWVMIRAMPGDSQGLTVRYGQPDSSDSIKS